MGIDLGLQGPDLRLMLLLLYLFIFLNGRFQFPHHTVKGVYHGPDLALSRRLHMDRKISFLHLLHALHYRVERGNNLAQEIAGKQVKQQKEKADDQDGCQCHLVITGCQSGRSDTRYYLPAVFLHIRHYYGVSLASPVSLGVKGGFVDPGLL